MVTYLETLAKLMGTGLGKLLGLRYVYIYILYIEVDNAVR